MGAFRLRITVAVAVLCLLPLVAPAAFVTSLQFQQATVSPTRPDADPSTPGRLGLVVVGFDKDPETTFLNMVAEVPGPGATRAWIVRNMPLVDITWGEPFEEIGYSFPLADLGVPEGETVFEIAFGYVLTPEPMSDDEAMLWLPTQPLDQLAPILPTTITVGGGSAPWLPPFTMPEPPERFYPVFDPFGFWSVWTWIGCRMDNVDLFLPSDENGCVPAGAANSMDWLDDQHDDVTVPDTRSAYEQLSNLMNRLAGKGVTTAEMARAKLDFIEAHNLPVHVKVQDRFSDDEILSSSGRSGASDEDGGRTWPNKEWLFSESLKGEDVEIMYGYYYRKNGEWIRDFGHCEVLTGTGFILDVPFITVKSDSSQTTPGGAAHRIGFIEEDEDGAMILPGFGGEWVPAGESQKFQHIAKIDGVVSESRDSTVTHPQEIDPPFERYCQYHTFTLAPGDTLSMMFPDTSRVRNFNVTVYEVERDRKPPKPRIVAVHRNNARKTRHYVNDSNLCMTVKIHNDEMATGEPEPDPPTEYQPWPVVFKIAKGGSGGGPPPGKNLDDGGGFSLGGDDDSAWEFGDISQPVVFFDAGVGASLGDMPAHLGTALGTQDLWIRWPVANWNPWWEQLGLVIDVAEVHQPGTLTVEIPETGDFFDVPITGPGRYEYTLMPTMPAPEINLHLFPQAGLEMTFDAIGVPTLLFAVSAAPDAREMPTRPVVLDIHPNPFNPATTIVFGIPESGHVELGVYDLKGRLVAAVHSGELGAGYHELTWDGRTVGGRPAAAGIYVARLETAGATITRKMTLVK